MAKEIERCYADHQPIKDNIDVATLPFNSFGKGAIKNFKCSPDGFVQMAIQLTYYKVRIGIRSSKRQCVLAALTLRAYVRAGIVEILPQLSNRGAKDGIEGVMRVRPCYARQKCIGTLRHFSDYVTLLYVFRIRSE